MSVNNLISTFSLMSTGHKFSDQLDIWNGGLSWYSEEAYFVFGVGGVIVAMVTLVFVEIEIVL